MRIALPQLLRTKPSPSSGSLLQRCVSIGFHQQVRTVHNPPPPIARHPDNSPTLRKHARNVKIRSKEPHGEKERKESDSKDLNQEDIDHQLRTLQIDVAVRRLSPAQRRDPEAWIQLLERCLPAGLKAQQRDTEPENCLLPSSWAPSRILYILHMARKPYNAGTDILAYMILHSKEKAALWLCDSLLNHVARKWPARPLESMPSNIMWPKTSLDSMTNEPFPADTMSHIELGPGDRWSSEAMDPRYSSAMSDNKDKTMDQIWSTLGSAVVQSANMTERAAIKTMNVVQLILGQIHNLDLVPENVYNYQALPFAVTVQRPPIVHLVSSRILTSLSDAAWRYQQTENIEKAARHGLTYEEIGRDPPGGRFRLRVRPMGPEVWLEFILWCCVEGGFASAGARIVKLLQQETRNPWFAVTWSNNNASGAIAPQIDWDRVQSRTGGTVGRLEGYSRGEPLATVPPRTISTEVVLALAETHIDTVRSTENGNGMTLEAAQNGIVALISFLEPHHLPVSYFDYLSARLLFSDAFNTMSKPKMLRRWYDRSMLLKSLASIHCETMPSTSYQLDSLSTHSEFAAGLLHQVIDAFVEEKNIHDALKAFDELQKLVDNSKLHAISAFLQRTNNDPDQFFTSRLSGGNHDFVESHGQLPLYKIAGLLNLATDSNLVGFGQYLLHSSDPDGPLVPSKAYSNVTIARALIRFGGVSNDTRLLELVSARLSRARLPSVNYLRTMFNARVSLLDFEGAKRLMHQLGRAQAGGYGLTNLAHLAGTILQLETGTTRDEETIQNATSLFHAMLSGHFDAPSGVFQRSVRTAFRQQVAHLLTLFEQYPGTSLTELAHFNHARFRNSNIPNLSPSIFNTFLEAVVDSYGAARGMDLVDVYCIHRSDTHLANHVLPGDYIQNHETNTKEDDDDNDDSWALDTSASDMPRTARHVPMQTQTFLPFVNETVSQTGEDSYSSRYPTNIATMSPDEAMTAPSSTDKMTGYGLPGETSFTSPFFPSKPDLFVKAEAISESRSESIQPVCVYDTRTIRVIARKAVQELREREAAKLGTTLQNTVLKWARRKFASLGCTSTMIWNEIKEPITDVELPDTRQRHPQNQTKRSRSRSTSPVTRTFSGRPIMGQ